MKLSPVALTFLAIFTVLIISYLSLDRFKLSIDDSPTLCKEQQEAAVDEKIAPNMNVNKELTSVSNCDYESITSNEQMERCFGHQPLVPVGYSTYENAATVGKYYRHNFDPKNLQKQTKTKILFYNSFDDYIHRMDRFYYDMVDAAISMEFIEAILWGPRFGQFDESVSLAENVARKFGSCDYFDIIYFLIEGKDIKFDCESMNGEPLKTVLMQELGDCVGPDHSCKKHYNPNAHVTILKYAFSTLELFNMNVEPDLKAAPPHMWAHNSDCCDPRVFYPMLPFSEKKHVARLFGESKGQFYPLREKIRNWISSGLLPMAEKRDHPGYNVNPDESALQNPPGPGEYSMTSPITIKHRKQVGDFASEMRGVKICIFDSSVVKQEIRKFMEALMSGCVIASDMPFEMEEELRDVIIELNVEDSLEEIKQKLSSALNNEEELKRKAAAGLALAHRHYTCYSKVERLLQFAEEYRKGFRGYYFPFGFRLGCHTYLYKYPKSNAWCA